MYSRKLALALVALLALAAVVAGCGGGSSSSSSDSSSTTSTESSSSQDESNSDEAEAGSGDSGGAAPTKAAFIKEADKICRAADVAITEEITSYAEENKIPTSEEPNEDQKIEIFHAVVLPNIGRQAEEIAELTPPEGDEGTIEELTDTLSSEVAEAEEADSVPDGSTLEGATKKAQAYGFKTCGG